jgi:hypothetical protein
MPSSRNTRPSAPAETARAVSHRPWARWAVGGIAVVALSAVVWFIASDVSPGPSSDTAPLEGVQTFAVASADHTTDSVQYDQDPPVGGPHDPTPLACGAYDAPVRNENAVHSLEHGAVWITYRPDLTAADVSDLDGFARQSEVIVSPYPGLDSSVVLSSWGTQLRLDSVDDDVITRFIRAYKNKTAPEINATC